MSEFGGEVSIQLQLDRREFDRDLQQLQTVRANSLTVAANLDTQGLRQQLNTLSGLNSSINVSVTLGELSQVRSQLDQLLVDRSIKIGVELDGSVLTTLERQLKSYRDRGFKVTAQVDDSQLTALNKHLDLKQKHFKQVNDFFKSSPLTPKVDLSQLDELGRKLNDLKSKQVEVKATVKYDTSAKPADIAQTVVRKVAIDTDDIEKKLGKSIESAFKSAKRGDLLGGLGSLAAAPLKIAAGLLSGVGGTIASGLIFGITQPLVGGLGQGISTALEKSLAGSVGSSQLLGEKVGGAVGSAIAAGASSKLQGLADLLDKQVDKIQDKKTRKDLKEKIAVIRTAPQQVKEVVEKTVGQEDAQSERLYREGVRRKEKVGRKSTIEDQAAVEFRDAAENFTQKSQAQNPEQLDRQIEFAQKELLESRKALAKVNRLIKSSFGVSASEFSIDLAPLTQQREKARSELELLQSEVDRYRSSIADENTGLSSLKPLLGRAKAQGDTQLVSQLEGEIKDSQLRIEIFEKSLQDLGKRSDAQTAKLQKTDSAIAAKFGKPVDEVLKFAQTLSTVQGQAASAANQVSGLQKQKKQGSEDLNQARARSAAARQTFNDLQPQQPKEYVELAKIALGSKFDADKLPELVIADESLKKAGAVSQYDPLRNRIEVTAEFFKQIQQSTLLAEQQANILAEELQHALDFDFGSAKGIRAASQNRVVGTPLVPTQEEFEKIAPNLGLYDPKRREIELSGKTGALRTTQQYQDRRGTLQQQSNASAFVASRDIVGLKSQGLDSKLSEFEAFSQKRGKDVTATTTAYRNAIANVQSGFDGLANQALKAANAGELDEAKLSAFVQRQQNLFDNLLSIETKLGDRINESLAKQKVVDTAKAGAASSNLVAASGQPKTTRNRANEFAEKAGQATRIALNGAQQVGAGIQSIVQSPQAISFVNGLGQAAGATVAIAKGGYAVASGLESFVLDLIPAGRTIKGIAKQTVIPAAAFGAATQLLPGGVAIGDALTNLASGALSPLANTAAGGASDVAAQFISSALPKVFGIQGAVTTAVTGAINGSFGAAIAPLAQAGTAILGGKVLTGLAGNAASSALNSLPQAGKQTLALPSKELKVPLALPSQRELVPVEVAPKVESKALALNNSAPVARQPQSTGQAIAFQAGQAARSVVDAGRNVSEIVQGAIGQAKNLDAQFSKAYKDFQEALKSGDTRLVKAYRDTLISLSTRGKSEIDGLIGELKSAGDKSGAIGQLGGVKGRLSQKEKLVTRATTKFEKSQQASGSDLSAQSLSIGTSSLLDAALDRLKRESDKALNAINSATAKFAEIEKQPTLRGTLGAATQSPKVQGVAKDLAVNTGGFLASQIGGQSGAVGQLGGDLIGALATRQALNAGISGVQAFQSLNQDPEFQKAPFRQKAGAVLREGAQRFAGSGAKQDGELFGDLTGFAIGNAAAQLPVPLPLKGAAVALAAVPQLAKLREKITGRLSEDKDVQASGSDLSAQSLGSGVQRTAKALDNKRRIILEQLEQSIGSAIDSLGLLLKQQPDLINNAKVTRTLARLNQTAQRVLENQVDVVDGVFEAETAKFNAELNALNDRVQSKLKNQPDFGLVADRGISNSVIGESEATVGLNRTDIGKNRRLINEQERKGLVVNPELLQVQDPVSSQFGKGAVGAVKAFLADINNDLTDAVLKRTRQLVSEAKSTLANDLKTSQIVAQGEGNTQQSRKLGKLSGKVEGAIGESESILAKPRVEVSPQDVARLKALEKEIKGVYAAVDRTPPGGGGFSGFLGNIKEKASQLPGILKQAAIGFVSFQVVNQALPALNQFGKESLQAAINLEKVKTALNFATGSSAGGAKELAFVRGEVDRLGVPLDAAQKGFTQLAAATKGSAVAGQTTRDIFTGISSAATVLGLSADESSGALLALTQIASKGTVQSEELRGQLGERIPGAFAIAARSMGVTEGELNKLLETGSVLSNEFLPKFARQLKVEFGGSAETASQNLQSSLFRVQSSFQKLQESSAKSIAPAATIGAQALSGTLGFLADNGEKVFGTISNLTLAIGGGAVIAFAKAAIGSKLLELGLSGAAGVVPRLLGALKGLAIQFAIVAAASETLRTVVEVFSLSDKAKEFDDFGNQGEKNLDRIAEAARRAKGEIDKVPTKDKTSESQGFDLTLGLAKLTGLDKAGVSLKTDDLLNVRNSALGSVNKAIGLPEDFLRATTVADLSKQRESLALDKFRGSSSELAGQGLEGRVSLEGKDANGNVTGKGKTANIKDLLLETQGYDKQLAALNVRKSQLQNEAKPDKNALAAIDKEQLELGQKRELSSAPVVNLQGAISAQLRNAKAALETATGSDKSKLEQDVKILEAAEANVNKLTSSIQTSVSAVRDLNKTFTESAIRLETIREKNNEAFKRNQIGDTKLRIKNFGTDENDSLISPVVSASRASDKAKADFEATRTELEKLQQEINKSANTELLSGITSKSTGKAITSDSSIAELEETKSGLSDNAKKQILDRLIDFKKNREKLTDLEAEAQDKELALIKAKEAAKIAAIDKAQQQRESIIKRRENAQTVDVIGLKIGKNVSEEDIGIKEAEIQKGTATNQLRSNQSQLSDLESGRADGTIGAEEYEKKRRAIEDSISDLVVKNAQADLAIVEAKNRKVVESYEKTYKLARAANDNDLSGQTINIRQSQLDGKIVGEGGQNAITEAEITAAERKQAILIQQEADLKGLRDQRVISEKEFIDRDLSLTQEAYSVKSQLIDLNTKQILLGIQYRVDEEKRANDEILKGINSQKAAQDKQLAVFDRRKQALDTELLLYKAIAESQQSGLKISSDRSGEAADLFKSLAGLKGQKGQTSNQRALLRQQLRELGFNASDRKGAVTALSAKNGIENRADNLKLESLSKQQQLERESLKIGLEKEKTSARIAVIEAKRAELQSKIALAEAKGNLLKAEKTGDKNEIANAQSQVGLATQNVELAGQGIGLAQDNLDGVDRRAEKEFQVNEFKQQQTRVEINEEIDKNRRSRDRTLAETADGLKVRGVQFSQGRGQYLDQVDPSAAAAEQFQQFQGTDVTVNGVSTSSVEKTVSKADATGNRDVIAKLEQMYNGIIQLANTPRVINLSSPDPVDDYARLVSKQTANDLRSS